MSQNPGLVRTSRLRIPTIIMSVWGVLLLVVMLVNQLFVLLADVNNADSPMSDIEWLLWSVGGEVFYYPGAERPALIVTQALTSYFLSAMCVVILVRVRSLGRGGPRWPQIAAGITAGVMILYSLVVGMRLNGYSILTELRVLFLPATYYSEAAEDGFLSGVGQLLTQTWSIAIVLWLLLGILWAFVKQPAGAGADTLGSEIPSGWYADTEGKPLERYWDGFEWTDEIRPLPGMVPVVKPVIEPADTHPAGAGSAVAEPDIPSGWYPDAEGTPVELYWDGSEWTGQVRPLTQPEPPEPASERTVSEPQTPSGWYDDPEGKPVQRYWDGSRWTGQVRPMPGSSPAAPA